MILASHSLLNCPNLWIFRRLSSVIFHLNAILKLPSLFSRFHLHIKIIAIKLSRTKQKKERKKKNIGYIQETIWKLKKKSTELFGCTIQDTFKWSEKKYERVKLKYLQIYHLIPSSFPSFSYRYFCKFTFFIIYLKK